MSNIFKIISFFLGLINFQMVLASPLVAPAFSSAYTLNSIGVVPSLPGNAGGITFKNGSPNKLLVGGNANGANGAIYEIDVIRDSSNRIIGFSGSATQIATAPGIDGGLTYGPDIDGGVSPAGSVLFYTTYSGNQLGQIKSGSSVTNRVIDLTTLGVAGSTGAVGFVPYGFPGAGRLKIVSYGSGRWYDGGVVTTSSSSPGTYDVSPISSSVVGLSGPEGFVYVKAGSPGFSVDSVVIGSFGANEIQAYEIDSNGDPIVNTKRIIVSNLNGALGAAIDPITGDFLFASYGSGGPIYVLSGFSPPLSSTQFTVGGTVTGLASGQSVVLLNNSGNSTTVSSNTSFTFSTAINSGSSYAVTVGTQPTGQTCTVINGTGTVSANVTNVNLTCIDNPVQPIPTLSEWAMILMASLMGLFAFTRIRRQS